MCASKRIHQLKVCGVTLCNPSQTTYAQQTTFNAPKNRRSASIASARYTRRETCRISKLFTKSPRTDPILAALRLGIMHIPREMKTPNNHVQKHVFRIRLRMLRDPRYVDGIKSHFVNHTRSNRDQTFIHQHSCAKDQRTAHAPPLGYPSSASRTSGSDQSSLFCICSNSSNPAWVKHDAHTTSHGLRRQIMSELGPDGATASTHNNQSRIVSEQSEQNQKGRQLYSQQKHIAVHKNNKYGCRARACSRLGGHRECQTTAIPIFAE